jgi:hypothetical protein
MLAVLHSFLIKLAGYWRTLVRSWRLLLSVLCVCYARGRDALLRRVEAHTELEELAVEEKRQQLAKQQANDIIDLIGKIEGIKDPQLRKQAKAAILTSRRALLPKDDAEARESRASLGESI